MNPKSKQQLRDLKKKVGFAIGHGHYMNDEARESQLDEIMQAFENFHTGEVERVVREARIDELKDLRLLAAQHHEIAWGIEFDSRITKLSLPSSPKDQSEKSGHSTESDKS